MYVHNDDVTYFDSFGIEHIPKDIKTFIGRSLSITTSIFRIQAYDSIMCGYFCIGFINFMIEGKNLTEFKNIFSPHSFKQNDNIILTILWIMFKNGRVWVATGSISIASFATTVGAPVELWVQNVVLHFQLLQDL